MQKCSFQSALIEQTNTQLHLSRNTYWKKVVFHFSSSPPKRSPAETFISIDLGIYIPKIHISYELIKRFECKEQTIEQAWSGLI